MKKILALIVALMTISVAAYCAPTDDLYQLGPDSMSQPNVPHGTLVGPLTLSSTVYPNTTRSYWIYVPAQYDPKTPASLMVFFDGHAFIGPGGSYRAPNVFDNLIYRREMPVTIGVFINPGNTPEQQPSSDQNWGDSINNRGIEYNALDDTYTKLVANELLPAVEKDYNISPNPDDHAIGGASSGAICAFTVAWHRPDLFHKVVSMIGSFTNIRGGDAYPDMIMKAKPKPLRVFLQDGVNDNRGMRNGVYDPRWDWHAQNIKMLAALTSKHYDVNYVWGIGTHSGSQGGAILPDMMRWIWRDYPRTDDPRDDSNRTLLTPATH
jgi:enterochelin esterase-like enzyme